MANWPNVWTRPKAVAVSVTKPHDPEFKDRYFAYRSQVEHEDQLMGMRVGWLIGAEAFLFAGYAKVLDTAEPSAQSGRLLEVLPLLGIGIAALILVAVAAAAFALKRLGANPPRSWRYPGVRGSGMLHALGLAPAIVIPLGVIAAWLYVWLGWFILG